MYIFNLNITLCIKSLMTMSLIKPILYPARECGPTKIGFSAHLQTSPCHRKTGFDSREV